MNKPKSFRVGIRRKVPYLTNLFLLIGGLCFLVVIVFDLLFYPFRSAGPEAQGAVFYWLVPEFWKKIWVFSVIGFCATIIIYSVLRYYKPATLTFNDNKIIVRGKAIKLTIPINTIRKIYCNDARKSNEEFKGELSITIEQKKRNKATAIRLKDYTQADEFMEELIKYENIELKVYDFAFSPIHMEEE